MARVQRGDVGGGEGLAFLAELGLDPGDHGLAVAVEHPQREAKRPHVFAAQGVGGGEAVRPHRVERELGDVERDHLERRERMVVQRIFGIARLAQVSVAERAGIDDDQAAGAQILHVRLERRGVHRDQHVGFVAGGFDGGRAEIDLEGGDAEGGALGRADLGGEVRERGQRVARERRGQRELAARKLHAVAGIARETDDGGVTHRCGEDGFGDIEGHGSLASTARTAAGRSWESQGHSQLLSGPQGAVSPWEVIF